MPMPAREPFSSFAELLDFDIPHTTFTLDNGLTVNVHENHQAPIVALNLWYHVGAKDEPRGKFGLAHLFEHLMFGGSKHLPGSYVERMLEAGALDVNGSTNHDRTNYYQTVPLEVLDFALFAESDRMGHFLDILDQDLLDRQRSVVINEKHQREGAPYGRMSSRQRLACYPDGHPYAHTVLGDVEHLESVTLEDARAWFSTFYTPSNAVLTLAGAIDEATARAKVERFFGHIPAGEPLARPVKGPVSIDGDRREVLQDRVPQPCVSLTWNLPPYGDRDTTQMLLLARVLGGGLSSRLHQRLVKHDQQASRINASLNAGLLNGQLTLGAWARPGQSLERLERGILEEVERLVENGVPEEEFERIKSRYLAGFVKGQGTATAIAGLLSFNHGMLGSAAGFKGTLQQIIQTTARDVQDCAQRWLTKAHHTLEVRPFMATSAPGAAPVREVPAIPAGRGFTLPELHRSRLDNGLQVVFVRRRGHPVTLLSLLVPTGAAADAAANSGLTPLASQLVDESGSATESPLEFSSALEQLGAELYSEVSYDRARTSLYCLSATLPQALERYATRLLAPQFSEADFARCRALHLDAVDSRLASAEGIVHYLLPLVMYPQGHPYAKPYYGGGSRKTLASLTYDQVHSRVGFDPSDACLLVVGDVDSASLQPELNRLLGQARSGKAVDRPDVSVALEPLPQVYLVDKPGALQTTLAAALLVPELHGRDDAAFTMLQSIVSNGFSSRLNMLLREEKNWTYGVKGLLSGTRETRIQSIVVQVQADRSADTAREILRELRELLDTKPVGAEELERFRRGELLRLSGGTEGVRQLADQVSHLIEHQLSDDYWTAYAQAIAEVTVDEVNRLARRTIRPEQLTWIVVGDLSEIGDAMRHTLSGEFNVVDPASL